jgi:hypothetical protein
LPCRAWSRRLENHRLDPPAAFLAAQEAHRHHPRVVDHQEAGRRQPLPDFGEAGVFDPAAGAVHNHQPGLVPALGRVLGNQTGRQFEIEIP